MRVFNKSSVSPVQTSQLHLETASWRVEYDPKSFVFKPDSGATVILEGDLHYYLDIGGNPIHFSGTNDDCIPLKRIYVSLGDKTFPENVEGVYNVAVIDEPKDTIQIFGDAFNRSNLFYPEDPECPVISTDFRDILDRFNTITYDANVLCCLIILGYPPAKHTPYQGVRRLAIGERLFLHNNMIRVTKLKAFPLPCREMNELDLTTYASIFENAIMSRVSQSENWAHISGGWDSTIVLGVLRKYFDTSNLRTIVQAFNFNDGRCYNPYEVEKSIEIAKHYQVPVEVAMTDLGDPLMPKLWADGTHYRRSDFVYRWAISQPVMANVTRNTGIPGSVFVGSFSDGLHNFGFSQYSSLPRLSYDFREYSDKMKSYLYSPTFLKKVIDNTFEDDFAYQLFRWYYSAAEFVDTSHMSRNERVFEYLLPFVISNVRLPFTRVATDSFFPSEARAHLKDWLYEHYFKDVVEQINPRNMYYWTIWLYLHFHLQGADKTAFNASLRGSDKQPCWPFYDLMLVRFLQVMPENWGRGLEWRPIKYPLKHYGCEMLNIPSEIVEATFHSYIDETEEGRSVDWQSEIISNSTMASTTWDDIIKKPNVEKYFNKDWFNISAMENALQTCKSSTDPTTTLNLLAILSTGFERK